MFFLLLLLCLLLLVATVLLWVPLVLELDTRRSVYRIHWWYLAQAHFVPTDGDLIIDGRILGFKKRWSLLKLFVQRRERKKRREAFGDHKKRRKHWSWRTVKRLLQSSTIHRFDVAFDTGNVMTNAMLFPIAEVLRHNLLSQHPGIRVNFNGDNHIDLKVSNRPSRIARAYLPSYINP